MTNELGRRWKKAVLISFQLLSWHLLGGNEENYETTVRIAGLKTEI